eukprot:8293238-Pyramimonas_sp.AAC.1
MRFLPAAGRAKRGQLAHFQPRSARSGARRCWWRRSGSGGRRSRRARPRRRPVRPVLHHLLRAADPRRD